MTPTVFTFDAIGTRWQIDINEVLGEEKKNSLFNAIQQRIALFDTHYSRFREDSLVMEMAKKKGTYVLPEDAVPMMDIYQELYEITEGMMTPLIGQVLSDAGYDATYSLVEKEMKEPPSWNDALSYSFPTLVVKEPIILDFGAAGKGYLIDIVAKIIEDEGITAFVIDAGGDILHRGNESLEVGLEHPAHFEQVIGVARISNKSIAGSAGNRRVWGRFHHIINPETLSSPQHIKALWVVADTTLLADALSTALFFVSPDKLSRYNFQYLIIHEDYSVEKSQGFPVELFLA